jgi:hypothetical protein
LFIVLKHALPLKLVEDVLLDEWVEVNSIDISEESIFTALASGNNIEVPIDKSSTMKSSFGRPYFFLIEYDLPPFFG